MRRVVWIVLLSLMGCGGGEVPSLPPVDEEPWLRLSVDRDEVPVGEGVNLRWESWGVTDCRAEGVWAGERDWGQAGVGGARLRGRCFCQSCGWR